jgi:hypothetical protein
MFWVTTMGWLFWRDLWPSWRPGEPPPFQIDDVEEVHRRNANPSKTAWTVFRQVGENQPQPVFRAGTWVDYEKKADAYTLNAEFTTSTLKSPDSQKLRVVNHLQIESMTSDYRVDPGGRLLSLKAKVNGVLYLEDRGKDLFSWATRLLRRNPAKGHKDDFPVELSIWGEVRGDQFFGHCQASSDEYLEKPIHLDLPATTVSYSGSVLMPLHPVNHIPGLRPGQSWHQPLVDPLRDALPGFSNGVRSLNARVLPQSQKLTSDDAEIECLVIEYTNDENDTVGRTWVEQSDNRVLQQEAIAENDRWIMKRDEPRSSNRFFGPADGRQRGIKHD